MFNTIRGMTALVTGGGSGLGLAVCRRLAGQGARVVTIDLKPNEEPIDNVLALKGWIFLLIFDDYSKLYTFQVTFVKLRTSRRLSSSVSINKENPN